MKLETDLNKIKKLSEQKDDENWKFRSFLKGYDAPTEEIDSIVFRLYKQISTEIDCKTCGNCCREVYPILNQKDIKKFSQGLGLPTNQFKNLYLEKDEESDDFFFNKLPCPFLKGNLCTNYENRPDDCRSFPHLHKKNFTTRLFGVLDNCSICPIVYNVYEYLKAELWQDRHFDFFDDYDY